MTVIKKIDKRKNNGGSRAGSGKPQKYNEDTTTVAFRVPISKVDEVKAAVELLKKKWLKKK